jgi:hypothetical protein
MEYFSVRSYNKNSFYIFKTEGMHFQPENIEYQMWFYNVMCLNSENY